MSSVDKNAMNVALQNLKGSALLGIDGMIDEVMELVDSRKGATEFNKLTRLMDFGNAITERGTGGLAKERILKRRACGGFVCNTGRAVATLGLDTTFLGVFGKEPFDPLFDEFKGLATLVSVGNPANIQVLEFIDGKIMMPHLDELIKLRWTDFVEKLGMERLVSLLDKDIVGVGYWSNMYDFENIMTAIVDICVANGRTKRIFHDFANLNKRTPEALDEALIHLGKLNPILPQTLSLNEHEGGILAEHFGIEYPEDVNNPISQDATLAAATAIREKTGLDEVVIHTLFYAVSATATNGNAAAKQNYCESPVKTTGAGDTFNGGYMVSCLTDLSPVERLTMANATTLCYVSTGLPPTIEQLMEQLKTF